MSWEPIAGRHAITLVRTIIVFAQSLPPKPLRASQELVQSRAQELAFTSVERVAPSAPEIQIQLGPALEVATPHHPAAQSGSVFKRVYSPDGTGQSSYVVEELGLRDNCFGYVATEYNRWADYESRLRAVLAPSLEKALDVTDIASLQLEYHNLFVFRGPSEMYSSRGLFRRDFSHVPANAISHQDHWEVTMSWARDSDHLEARELYERRYRGVQAQPGGIGPPIPGMQIVNGLTVHFNNEAPTSESVWSALDVVHRLVMLEFETTMSQEMNDRLNIRKEEYMLSQ